MTQNPPRVASLSGDSAVVKTICLAGLIAVRISQHYRMRNSCLKLHSVVAVLPSARFGAHAA